MTDCTTFFAGWGTKCVWGRPWGSGGETQAHLEGSFVPGFLQRLKASGVRLLRGWRWINSDPQALERRRLVVLTAAQFVVLVCVCAGFETVVGGSGRAEKSCSEGSLSSPPSSCRGGKILLRRVHNHFLVPSTSSFICGPAANAPTSEMLTFCFHCVKEGKQRLKFSAGAFYFKNRKKKIVALVIHNSSELRHQAADTILGKMESAQRRSQL